MRFETLGTLHWLALAAALVVNGAILSAALILLLRPLLVRYALARPSARGLHSMPTPQGGGIAVLVACGVTAILGADLIGINSAGITQLLLVLGVAAALALLGFVDDVRPLPAGLRLVIQIVLMAAGISLLPEGTRVLPFLPVSIEDALLVLAGTWFINLTNFMDGMDGITVVDVVPVAAGLVLFFTWGRVPLGPSLLALGTLAGLLGYAPFNKPVARLFLGDVGSLPIGFLVAYGLFSLAGAGGGALAAFVSAVILALYPIADSSLTLLWRLKRRERIWEPHRSHYYQVAVLRGLTVWQVLARVGLANMLLAGLAGLSLRLGGSVPALAGIAAAVVVGVTLGSLSRANGNRAVPPSAHLPPLS